MDREELKILILNVVNYVENIDKKVDILIEKYYKQTYLNPYLRTKNKLTQMMLEEGEFPCVEKWNEIAAKDGYFSSTSIKYIENCNWKKLEQNIKRELKSVLIEEENEESNHK